MDFSKAKESLSKLVDDCERKEKEVDRKFRKFEESSFISSTEDGLCKVVMNSSFEITDLIFDDSILGDKETIRNLFISCVNSVTRKICVEGKRIQTEAYSVIRDIMNYVKS